MRHFLRQFSWIATACICAAALAGCGGGGGGGSSLGGPGGASSGQGGSSGGVSTSGGTTMNSIPVTVDGGPAALVNAQEYAANILYVTVTICTPGSTTACQAIDHVEVDTGSYGVSINAGALSSSVTPAPVSVSGGILRECEQYADGYTWGSIVTVDMTIGERTISSLPINLVSDPAAGAAPGSCSSGAGNSIGTVASLGANGVIGIGYFLQDCGEYCVGTAQPGGYYACPASGCVPTTVALNQQLQNPIGALSADNNGAVIALPAANAEGQASLSGTLYFGVGTESNNGVGAAQFLTVEPGTSQTQPPATLLTTFNGSTMYGSVVDSGSNANYFNDASLTACTNTYDTGFYCSSAALSATLQGVNGATAAVDFDVGDADTLFNTTTVLAVFPTLAGPNASIGNAIPGFDWGLPFFYGRRVYVLFENGTAGATAGPAIGF
jgi:hypothetical protein